MRRTFIVLIALAGGLAAGSALARLAPSAVPAIETVAAVAGRLWVNAMQMTVIPLVMSLVITGVSGLAGASGLGRAGARTLLLFVAILASAAAFGTVVAIAVVPLIPAADVTAPAVAKTGEVTGSSLSYTDLITRGIVPANVAQAAAEGALLPLIVFALAFGIALPRIPAERRDGVVSFFRGVADAMLVVLGWVLLAAPVGVFALALSVGLRTGGAAVPALGAYVVVLSGLLLICLAGTYMLAVFGGGVPMRRFAVAMLPAQAIAFSSRASMVALPALVEAADRQLRLPRAAAGIILPLAVSTLRVSSAAGLVVSVAFAARMYGGELSLPTVVVVAAMSVLLSFSVPGTVSGGFLGVAAALLQIAKVPVEAAAILLAVDAIPDMIKTVLNVTAHMSATTVAARWTEGDSVTETRAMTVVSNV